MRASAAAAAGLVLVASSAFADGVVMGSGINGFLTKRLDGGRVEAAVDPTIPDQRALIVHRDGKETLVIETAFQGPGTEFAWVVPTPSIPTIVEAPVDLFPALVDATRPALVSQVPDLGVAGAVVVAGLLLARHGGRRGRRAAKSFVAGAIALALLAPAGSAAHDAGPRDFLTLGAPAVFDVRLPTTPEEAPVAVRNREVVGAFDVVTLATRDAGSLVEWLDGHGYRVPEALEHVAADYVRDGWVFNAMRLHRDGDRGEAVRIRPLAFTFDAASPVYPMRLTAVGAKSVLVDLFVAGGRRAQAEGFDVLRCARIDADSRHDGDLRHVVLGDEPFQRLVGDASVLTRLDRTFSTEEMKTDVAVGAAPYETIQRTVFSTKAVSALSWNAGALIAIGAFIALASAAASSMVRRPSDARRRWTATALVLVLALDAGLSIAAFLPSVPTQPVHVGR